LLIEGARHCQTERAALVAALLSERDPFTPEGVDVRRKARRDSLTSSDVLDRTEALEEFARNGRTSFPCGSIKRGAARLVLRASEQLARSVRKDLKSLGEVERAGAPSPPVSGEEALGRALLAAFPDRLARRREPGSSRGVMVGGRGVRLSPASGVGDAELFLCIDVDAGKKEALVRQASAVRRDWLPAAKLVAASALVFDETTERVVARRRLSFEDLVIEEGSAAITDEAQATEVLVAAATEQLDKVLPPADSSAGHYLLRVRCLREWLPELRLPEFNAGELKEVLATICHGCRSFADLRQADWQSAVQNCLTPFQRQAVEREAPERIEVPSGSRLALRYEAGRPPVLEVRIQELFGLRDTPRIAGGRRPVLLHLLAPNHRPQQVTDDLASFWANTYPQIRKELRARYPKHAWPEDPWSAVPEERPRRRR
jgi:ATP-dependent helicase HrpB